MKYQVGDKVKIVSVYKGDNWCESMGKYLGTVMTIKSAFDSLWPYTMEEDDGYWSWGDEMIEGLASKTKNKKEIEQMPTEKITFEKTKQTLKKMGVEKVVFNKPVVVVYLTDGRKGVAKCGELDTFDEEVGFALAYTIAVTSDRVVNKSNYKRHIDNLSFRKARKKKDCVVVNV